MRQLLKECKKTLQSGYRAEVPHWFWASPEPGDLQMGVSPRRGGFSPAESWGEEGAAWDQGGAEHTLQVIVMHPRHWEVLAWLKCRACRTPAGSRAE